MAKKNLLTVSNFSSVFLNALDEQPVQDKLLSTFHDMIELIVSEKVEAARKDLNEKVRLMKKDFKETNESLAQELDKVKKENLQLKQYSYKEDLIIKGLDLGYAATTDTKSEVSVKDKVLELVNDKMGLNINPESISTAHKLPTTYNKQQLNAHGNMRNPLTKVIVRFSNRDARNKVYSKRMSLKHVSPGKFIDEHLIEESSRLMGLARKFKKDGKIKNCWTNNCKLYVRLCSDKSQEFSTEAELLSLIDCRHRSD